MRVDMEWFEGNLQAANQEATERPSVWVVYATGEDDISRNMSQTWESAAVHQAIEHAHMVCKRLSTNSEEYRQFAEFYPQEIIPTTLFFDNNNVLLEEVHGFVQPEQLVQLINNVDQMFRERVQQPPENNGNRPRWRTWLAVGGALALGAVAAPLAVPVALGAVGFTSAGVAGGSLAAGWMSAAAIANGGGIAAGSAVAVAQSIGAAGLGAGGTALVSGAGAAIGAAVGGIAARIHRQPAENEN